MAGEEIMERIEGTVATAISYAKTIDAKAREQIRRMCSYELTKGSRVRIMPDVHAGKGCTIGTTMTITDKAVPNIVGVDIGCGMYTIDLGKQPIDFAKLDAAAHIVPSGMNVWPEKRADFNLQQLYCYQHFTTFTPPRKLMKLVYTRPELSPLDFLRFGP